MFKTIVLVLKKKKIFLNNPILITVLGRLGGGAEVKSCVHFSILLAV